MRRPRKSSGGSLDSLLDTMTNVVGILVILLTVTQLGVGDAVKRISTTESVKPEALEEAKKRLRELLRLRAQLAERLKAFEQKDDGDAAERLRQLLREIEDYKADTSVLEEKQQAAELELRKLKQEAERLLAEQEKEADELLAKLNQGEEELASLRAKLSDTPTQGPLPAKVINLPNPRPAPEGTEPLTFFCREGRIMFADFDGIQDWAQKRANFIVQRRALGRNPDEGVDGKILVEEFNRDKGRHRDFDVEMTLSGRLPRLRLLRKRTAGETAEQIQRTSSRYQQQVRRTDPRKFYLRFLVWPDSFETYLQAREICSRRGLLAGWQAQTTQEEYAVNLEGDLRVGPPPPPPKPKPKPKPGEEPPPKPKPAAPPRTVPTDVID